MTAVCRMNWRWKTQGGRLSKEILVAIQEATGEASVQGSKE